MSASAAPLAPLIVVMGATGTGKSQLAVDLAKRFNGEIINGDAMQLYDGLPITTNKMPLADRQNIPHHLLGCIELAEQPWSVDRFVPRALQVMDEIRARGKLPVLVGGTHYYTQALLFRDALVKGGDDEDASAAPPAPAASTSKVADTDFGTQTPSMFDNGTTKWSILEAPTDQILAKLREVDPVMAERWHPNDRRKISRSLEIWLDTGRKASDIYDDQTKHRSSALEFKDQELLPGLRFRTLIFWTHAAKDILNARLNQRVVKMVTDGLLREAETLFAFRRAQEIAGTPIDQTRGIWVAIGFKEFLPYLEAVERDKNSNSQEQLTPLYDEAIERTEIHTRQYANYQIKWIRNKLLPALRTHGARPFTFALDASDLVQWETAVVEPAMEITKAFLDHSLSLPEPMAVAGAAGPMLTPKRDYEVARRRDLWKRQTCEVCGTTTISEEEWQLHVNSKRHRKLVRTHKARSTAEQALRRLSDASVSNENPTLASKDDT